MRGIYRDLWRLIIDRGGGLETGGIGYRFSDYVAGNRSLG
jgi:hypothetical protein